ncbi:hypothetical protein SAMN06264364_13325 [Quadrisphaera granulorum]|uniref:Tfp pilus assembly protein PilO n=1 Tax=Quadrisphaera granulorum TaxID=317664 RepID=A0A315ZQZ8_9ACTN|nr:type 4a pilus biogenesis protein PilO [Quadrisphaera granulorum]PWJ48001.1 hypothetical protein BXY45_13325 [Quadrisphaera granulorum]SZE98573.1 hypothetical protein SAMN06264364_13325 [Quadrisphaera granulorum]
MLANTPRTWVAGTSLLAVLLVAAAWLLLISPQRDQVADLNAQQQSVVNTNVLEAQKLKVLVEQSAQLPASKAELASLRQALPATLDLSPFSRQIDAAATAAGVALVSVTPAAPAQRPAAAAVPATAASTATEPTAGASEQTAPTTSSAAVAGLADVVQMPVTVQVVGSFAEVQAFLDQVQDLSRSVLVTTISATVEQAAPASPGKPATQAGDLSTTIGMTAFVLPSSQAPTASAIPSPSPAPATTA